MDHNTAWNSLLNLVQLTQTRVRDDSDYTLPRELTEALNKIPRVLSFMANPRGHKKQQEVPGTLLSIYVAMVKYGILDDRKAHAEYVNISECLNLKHSAKIYFDWYVGELQTDDTPSNVITRALLSSLNAEAYMIGNSESIQGGQVNGAYTGLLLLRDVSSADTAWGTRGNASPMENLIAYLILSGELSPDTALTITNYHFLREAVFRIYNALMIDNESIDSNVDQKTRAMFVTALETLSEFNVQLMTPGTEKLEVDELMTIICESPEIPPSIAGKMVAHTEKHPMYDGVTELESQRHQFPSQWKLP